VRSTSAPSVVGIAEMELARLGCCSGRKARRGGTRCGVCCCHSLSTLSTLSSVGCGGLCLSRHGLSATAGAQSISCKDATSGLRDVEEHLRRLESEARRDAPRRDVGCCCSLAALWIPSSGDLCQVGATRRTRQTSRWNSDNRRRTLRERGLASSGIITLAGRCSDGATCETRSLIESTHAGSKR